MRCALLAPAALCLASLAGCNETVGFVALSLGIPDYETPIKCDADPRRITSLTLTARCETETIEETFEVKRGEGLTASLGGVPLQSCAFSVAADNTHGRTVLSGKSEYIRIQDGTNEAVKILLTEEAFEDSDSDGLATTDEQGLKLSPSAKDSDGDGLEDDVEVLDCCTWPAGGQKQCQKMFITGVELTEYGPVGETVLVKASKALDQPRVILGGVGLTSAIPDSTLVFGKVGPGAVLGKVTLSSGKEQATFRRLYGVLRQDEELLPELDQKAGASTALMQEAGDLVYVGSSLLILGKTTVSGSSFQVPILLRVDLAKNIYSRTILVGGSTPVALATGGNWLAALLTDSSGRGGRVLLFNIGSSGELTYNRGTSLGGDGPVDMLMEPSGEVLQVLFRDRLTRLRVTPWPQQLSVSSMIIGALPNPGAPGSNQVPRCTGLAYHEPAGTPAGRGASYLACNMLSSSCPQGQACPARPALLQLSPTANCVVKGNPEPLRDPCWVHSVLSSPLPAAGAPVVDAARKQVYLMTSGRILAAPLGASSIIPLRQLTDLISFSRTGTTPAASLMAQDDRGYLYAVNGDHVHRLEPSQPSKGARLGKEVKLSEFKEESWMLALSPDGSLLSVIKRRGAGLHSLMSVCLKRCSGCLCQ